ncbi:MAG: YHS domain-containing (seleno)protein [Pseudomonadota bacterium]
MNRYLTAALCAITLSFGALTAEAGSDDPTLQVVNSTSRGIAIDGFDPVAYFTEGTATKGDPAYRASHQGRVWLFASEENRDLFTADPVAYAPQNNGWCTWAVAHEYAAESDFIDGWFIDDGKLYMTWSAEVKERFLKDKDNLVQQSATNWDNVHDGLKDGSGKFFSHAMRPELGFQHPQQLPES